MFTLYQDRRGLHPAHSRENHPPFLHPHQTSLSIMTTSASRSKQLLEARICPKERATPIQSVSVLMRATPLGITSFYYTLGTHWSNGSSTAWHLVNLLPPWTSLQSPLHPPSAVTITTINVRLCADSFKEAHPQPVFNQFLLLSPCAWLYLQITDPNPGP